jgi:predicted O-methyltransferase YrrM
MSYEITTAWRTLRREGPGPLFKKVILYFHQMRAGLAFARAPRPDAAKPEAVVDFSFTVAGGLIAPGQVRSEIVSLAGMVRERQPRTVVEIGTATGGTLFLWCAMAHPEATVVSIDLPGGIHGGGYPYWKTWVYRRFATGRQRVHLLRGDSHDPRMRDRLKAMLPDGGIDFLFIDGDHTYEGVKSDYEMYAPLVRPGGLIAFHDIAHHPPELNCHVEELWRQLKQGRRHWEFVEDPQQGSCGLGVLEV